MRLTFDRTVLEEAIDRSMCAVAERNAIPVVEGIRLRTEKNGKCSITTYDLEKGFYTEIDCRIEEAGNYVINASKLCRIIKAMPDLYVTIEVNEKCAVTVTSGKSKFELHAMSGDAFPNIPALTGDRGFVIGCDVLKRIVAQTSFSIGYGVDTRPMLCGAYITIKDGKIKIAACDGNRLAVREKSCELENSNKDQSDLDLAFIVPGKTVGQLSRLMGDEEKIKIMLARKHVIFKLKTMTFFSRLIDSEYIDYERVIPKTRATVVKCDRAALISSLERASLVTEDRTLGQARSYVKASFEGDLLKLNSVSTNGSVYDEIQIEHEGEDVVVGFNCRYLLDALRAADTDRVELILNGQLTSIVILPVCEEEKGEDFLYMVSPVRMK